MIIRAVLAAAAVVCTALPGGPPPGAADGHAAPVVVSAAGSVSASTTEAAVWWVRAEPASYQLAAQAGAVTGEPPRKVCDFGFVPVKPTVGAGSIIGTAWAQCDVPPDSHVMVVSLQRRDGGWQTIASSDPDRQIPPGPPQRVAYQVKTACVPGAWRISATATGTLQGRSGTLTDYSLERIVSQQECDRGK